MTEAHAIISFDIGQLPQAQHGYTGQGATMAKMNIPRAKVPVRDGHSQGVSHDFSFSLPVNLTLMLFVFGLFRNSFSKMRVWVSWWRTLTRSTTQQKK